MRYDDAYFISENKILSFKISLKKHLKNKERIKEEKNILIIYFAHFVKK